MDNTPTALFDSYEADFKGLMESVKGRLEGAGVGGTWTNTGGGVLGVYRSAALYNTQMHSLILTIHRATQGCYAES